MENLNQLKIALADSNKTNKRLIEQFGKALVTISKVNGIPIQYCQICKHCHGYRI